MSAETVLDLIDLHRKQYAEWLLTECNTEQDRAASDAQADTWWRLMDAMPANVEEAIALAKYVSDLEDREMCPTVRIPGDRDTEENVALIALRRVAAFFETNPAVR